MSIEEMLQPTGEVLTPEKIAVSAIAKLSDDAGAIFELDVMQAIRQLYTMDKPALDKPAFARCRSAIKSSGKVRMSDFDDIVRIAEQEESGLSEMFPEQRAWHEAVNGEKLLTEIKETIKQFVVADEPSLTAASLWVVFTWVHHLMQVSPIAHITAPEKRCGKSVLLECLTRLSYRAIPASSISSAAIYRCIERWEPTLLIDEADSFMRDDEDLRGIINSGFNKSAAFVVRCVGDDHEPTKFSTWAAKALCGIGKLPGTIEDRSIPLILRRKQPHEQTKKIRRTSESLWDDLRAKILRWTVDNQAAIKNSIPDEVDGLNDRAQDAWEPLLQAAEVAGPSWLKKARNAAISIHGLEEETLSLGVELLRDIRDTFKNKKTDRLFTRGLIEGLCEDEEAPWVAYNRGKPITSRQLSKRLSEYKVSSNTIRKDFDTAKGYKLEQFTDAFKRYIPADGALSVTPSQTSSGATYSDIDKRHRPGSVTDEIAHIASNDKGCDVVTGKKSVSASKVQKGRI